MIKEDIEAVKAFIRAINSRSPSQLYALMTEDHVFIDATGRSDPNRDHLIAGWEAYFRMFPDYEITVDNILSDNGLVAIFGSASGTYNGNRGLVPENRIEMPAAWKAIVRNGKIKHWQVYADWTDGHRIIAEDGAMG